MEIMDAWVYLDAPTREQLRVLVSTWNHIPNTRYKYVKLINDRLRDQGLHPIPFDQIGRWANDAVSVQWARQMGQTLEIVKRPRDTRPLPENRPTRVRERRCAQPGCSVNLKRQGIMAHRCQRCQRFWCFQHSGYSQPGSAIFPQGTKYLYVPDCPICREQTIKRDS